MRTRNEQERRSAPLGPIQFCVLGGAVFVVVFIAVSFIWSPLVERYLLTTKAPALESEFGFRAGYKYLGEGYADRHVFTITHLTPGGPLENAGFREGDILGLGTCTFYGEYVVVEDFFDDLEKVRAGQPTEFLVYQMENGRLVGVRRIVLNPLTEAKQ